MPKRAKRPCAYPGCAGITDKRYCDKHEGHEKTLKSAAQRDYNRYRRDSESNRNYGRSWKEIRARFLSANPLCELCKARGRLVPAALAHHKIKITDGGTNDRENLQALCAACHSRLHAERGDYF